MNAVLPVRHDMITFNYHDKMYRGEVRRVYSKPKGNLVIVKIGEKSYRSCYLEQMKDFVVEPKVAVEDLEELGRLFA